MGRHGAAGDGAVRTRMALQAIHGERGVEPMHLSL
jgi:hypothetical protein